MINLNNIAGLFRKKPKRNETTGVTTGMWDVELWDTDLSYFDPIARIYSPQNSQFRYPYGLYDEAEIKNTHLRSALGTRVKAMLAMPVRLLPADKSDEANTRMMFVKYALERMGRGEAIGGLSYMLRNMQHDGLFYPFTTSEILWDYEGKEIIIHQIKVRHPRNFMWDNDEKLHFCDRNGKRDKVEPNKFLIYSPLREQDHPYKGGIGRNVFHIHHLWRLNLRWWGTANERGGIPLLTVKGVDFLDEGEKGDLEGALDGLKNNTYLVIPDGIDIDAFESKLKAATTTFKDLAVFCKTEISKLILGETLTAEQHGEAGGYSLGRVHHKILGDYAAHDAIELMALMNGQLIPHLIAYNFPGVRKDGRQDFLLPKYFIEYEPPEDSTKSLLVDQGLHSLGVPLSISAIRNKYNVQEPKDEEDTLKKATPSTLGLIPSKDPDSQSEPDADNRKQDGIKDGLRDTNRGKGLDKRFDLEAAFGELVMATSLTTAKQSKDTLDVMDEFTDTVIKDGDAAYKGVHEQLLAWIDKYDQLDKMREDMSWDGSSFNLDTLRLYVTNALFQAYVVGFANMFKDPRINQPIEAASIENATSMVFSPEDIITLFEQRLVLERAEYDTIHKWARSRAFTVSDKIRDMIRDNLLPLVQKGIYEGKTVGWFKEQTKGILNPAHAETVFRTNVNSAFNTGRMDAIFHPSIAGAFPAIQYFVVEDEHTTDICRALIDVIIPIDEMTRGQFLPPFHYNCRTLAVAIHISDFKEMPADKVLTGASQQKMPKELRPLSDFGYYEPVIRVA